MNKDGTKKSGTDNVEILISQAKAANKVALLLKKIQQVRENNDSKIGQFFLPLVFFRLVIWYLAADLRRLVNT